VEMEAEPAQQSEPQQQPDAASEFATEEWEVEPDLDMGMEADLNNKPTVSTDRSTDEHLGPDELDLEVDLSDISSHDRDDQRPPHA
jgi:hypothetical protein